MSKLIVGLQCRGSDGYSGMTANPALGRAVDLLVAHGGTAILSETPEIYGAEHLLTGRASPEVSARLMGRIAWWERHVETIIATASSEVTASEALGFGEDEIQPWRLGATM